jgi:hypothetical protein
MSKQLTSSEVEYQNDEMNDNKNTNEKCDQENCESEHCNCKNIPFWINNPNVLFQQEYLLEFFPVDSMVYSQKLNAITRTVILLVIIGFLYSNNFRILLIGFITLFSIYLLQYYHNKQTEKRDNKRTSENIRESFTNPSLEYMKNNNIEVSDEVFDKPDSSNPFGNVLVSDYDYNPNKKPAPPAYNKIVEKDILTQAKKFVSDANPDHPNIADKLFGDMGSNMEFEQSLRPFHSTANTMIPNDQGAFAEFCYGSMISCKEGNEFACARNLSRHVN